MSQDRGGVQQENSSAASGAQTVVFFSILSETCEIQDLFL